MSVYGDMNIRLFEQQLSRAGRAHHFDSLHFLIVFPVKGNADPSCAVVAAVNSNEFIARSQEAERNSYTKAINPWT